MSPSHRYGTLVNLSSTNPAGSTTSFTKLLHWASNVEPSMFSFSVGRLSLEPVKLSLYFVLFQLCYKCQQSCISVLSEMSTRLNKFKIILGNLDQIPSRTWTMLKSMAFKGVQFVHFSCNFSHFQCQNCSTNSVHDSNFKEYIQKLKVLG